MRKIVMILLCVSLLFSCAMAEDYSKMTNDDLRAAIDLMRNELVKRELTSEEKILLFSEKGVSLYLTGEYEIKRDEIRLLAIVVNDGSEKVDIYSDYSTISVNGWDVFCSTNLSANGGKKSKGYFEFKPADADISSFEEITDIEFHIYYKIDGQRTHLDPIPVQYTQK